MIAFQYLRPHYRKIDGDLLTLVFYEKSMEIRKDDETLHFIPIEGKEIVIDLLSMQVKNLSDEFVFQRGNRFIRLAICKLLLISNIHDLLIPILADYERGAQSYPQNSVANDDEIEQILKQLHIMHLRYEIDRALVDKNASLFVELTNELKAIEQL